MRIQIASDIHTEFHKKVTLEHFIHRSADVLLLAGDVGIPTHPSYRSFLEQCNANYRRVLLIAGNHEFYGSTFDSAISSIRDTVSDLRNITFLNDESYRFEEEQVTVLGSTLWSAILPREYTKVWSTLSDYKKIATVDGRQIRPQDIIARHTAHTVWLRNEIERRPEEKIVVMTHHLPSYRMCSPKYSGCGYNSGFATDLESMIAAPIKLWVCGHSHERNTQTINGVPCILNPTGYPSEVTSFDLRLVWEL